MSEYETIVLGLGAMGSSALYQLSKRGHRVLGIDQFSPPHTLGSTHGDTRITRRAIGEGEHLSPLSMRSYEIFAEIEELTGEKLLEKIGGLIISSEEKTSICFVPEFFNTTVAAAQRFGIRHEIWDAKEIRKRYPQFNVRDDEAGYFEYEAGFLRPERCVDAQLKLAEQQGAAVHRYEKVSGYSEKNGGFEVKTDRGTYTAQHLVVSAGSWLPVLDPTFKNLLTVTRQILFWFDIKHVYEKFRPENMPVFIWEVQDARYSIYGFPAVDGPDGGFKVAASVYGDIADPDNVNRVVSEEETDAIYELQVKPFFPDASRKCVRSAICLYSSTSDAGFIIDRHPKSPNLIICSPCSGHGFKHSAAIGEAVSQMIMDGSSQIDLKECSLSRRLPVA
jgi:sarcosine oxidase